MRKVNGWSQPSNYGTLCFVKDYKESGSNLIIEVEATSAFAVEEIIQPVQPSLVDSERFPGVEELMEKAGNPIDGKLYLRADVNILRPPEKDYDNLSFTSFVELMAPASQILQMSGAYKGQILMFKNPENYSSEDEKSDFIWKVCCAICYDVELQQEMLSQTSFSALMEICKDKINQILARLEEE